MSLVTEISDLVTRLGTEFKAVKVLIAGVNTGSLTGLTTSTKTSLLAAINELVTSIGGKIASSEKGAASGVCPLNSSSKIDSTYLPAYVDDVLEVADLASLPGTGATGIIYVTIDNNHTFRWTGSVYVDMSTAGGGLASFNGRSTAAAVPTAGDYDAFYYTESEIGDPATDFVTAFETALT